MDNNEYISKQKVEKWTTKENFIKLGDLRDIEPGTEYNLTGAIEEGELGSALQAKINGKLDKPTTPTAESAIVIGTDGTASTKPLSEFSGKLYRHTLLITYTSGQIIIDYYSYDNTEISVTNNNIPEGEYVGLHDGAQRGAIYVKISKPGSNYQCSISGVMYSPVSSEIVNVATNFDISDFSDTVTEL